MKLSERIRAFARTPSGYGIFLAVIVLLVSASILFGGVELGIIGFLVFGFGVPIYLGWNKSFRTMAIVGLVILVAVGPVLSVFLTNQYLQPSPAAYSSDGLLQNGIVTPFSASGNHGKYDFQVAVYPSRTPQNGTVRSVTLYVTNCPLDNYSTGVHNSCGGNPDYFLVVSQNLTPSQTNSSSVRITFSEQLPGNEILNYIFRANYSYRFTSNNTTVTRFGYSCAGYSPSGAACGWVEGPVTGTFGSIYGLVLLDSYALEILPGIILFAILGLYVFLKRRERRRQEAAMQMAEGTAGAEGSAPLRQSEATCPSCHAVVNPGEDFCWKCGTKLPSIPGPSSSNARNGNGTGK